MGKGLKVAIGAAVLAGLAPASALAAPSTTVGSGTTAFDNQFSLNVAEDPAGNDRGSASFTRRGTTRSGSIVCYNREGSRARFAIAFAQRPGKFLMFDVQDLGTNPSNPTDRLKQSGREFSTAPTCADGPAGTILRRYEIKQGDIAITAIQPNTEVEPNDNIQQATVNPVQVFSDRTITGGITPNNRDFFQMQVTGSGQATFRTSGLCASESAGDTVLGLFNSSGQQLAVDDDSDVFLCSRITLNLTPGIYYIAVTGYSDFVGGSNSRRTFDYTLSIDLP